MATLHPPLNLNTASLQDMLDVGWIPPQDAEEIVRQREPGGRLYLAWLLRTTSLYQMKLDQLIQQGMITVHFQDDDNLEETQSLLSDTSSMREEMEAMREENRLLREAMEQQTRLQQDVLARYVDEMATRDRSDRIAVREQQDNSARRTASDTGAVGGKNFNGHEWIGGGRRITRVGCHGTADAAGVCSPIDESLRDSVRAATGFAERPSDKVVGWEWWQVCTDRESWHQGARGESSPCR